MYSWIHWIDLAGVAVFAMSGTLMAYKKRMDGFGVVVLAAVTAIGGGTLRDMLLDTPVFWLRDPSFFYVILAAALGSILWLRNSERFPLRYLLLLDAVGLSVFNLIGLQKALAFGVNAAAAIVLGTMTACFGGLIRDVICREIPLVFQGELYATTCILGGFGYVIASKLGLHTQLCMLLAVGLTLSLRLMSMRWHWHVQVFKNR